MKLMINGSIKKAEKTPLDFGYFYGYGCFETIYVKDYEPFLLEAHLKRLHEGLNFLGIHKTIDESMVRSAIASLGAKHCGLKINVSPSNVVFSLREIRYSKQDYIEGQKLRVSDVWKNRTSPTVRFKTMNYMDALLVNSAAKEAGFDDAIMLNDLGHVCETTVANILVEKDGKLMTPPLDDGLLPGVMRHYFMEHLDILEATLTMEDLYQSDGVYLTNSLVGAIKVSEIEGHKIAEGTYGSLLAKTFLEGR